MIKSTLIFTAALLLLGLAATAFAGEGCCPDPSAKPATIKGHALGPRPQPGMEPGAMILQHLERVQPPLTNTQRDKIKNLAEDIRAKLHAAKTHAERHALRMQLHKTVIETILTDEQRASLAAQRPPLPPGPRPGMEHGPLLTRFFDRVQPPLTDAQKEQIKKLAEETRAKAATAQTPAERRALHMQLRKTVISTILTEEQRASLPPRGLARRGGAHCGPQPPAQPPQQPPQPPAAE